MVRLKKTLSIILEALALIGLIAGLLFAFQFARANFLPPSGSNVKDVAAYPPPGATQVYMPLPTYTPILTWTPTPIMLDNGWYLYIDEEAGYSFSYPPDAYLSSGQSTGFDYKSVTLSFRIPDASGYQGMQIIVYSNKERLPIERVSVDKVFQGKSESVTEDSVLFAMIPVKVSRSGYDAIKISVQPFETAVLMSVEDKVFFFAPSPDMRAGNPPDPKSIELFYKILDTFTLMNK
jgi:hypothetical protein